MPKDAWLCLPLQIVQPFCRKISNLIFERILTYNSKKIVIQSILKRTKYIGNTSNINTCNWYKNTRRNKESKSATPKMKRSVRGDKDFTSGISSLGPCRTYKRVELKRKRGYKSVNNSTHSFWSFIYLLSFYDITGNYLWIKKFSERLIPKVIPNALETTCG
jgi:hypothetical protein